MSNGSQIKNLSDALQWAKDSSDGREVPYKDDHGKCAIDYLRDSIVEAVIKNHPNATREEILEGMDAMGF